MALCLFAFMKRERSEAAYYKEGKYKEAIDAFCSILETEGDNAELYNNIGLCYANLGEDEKSLAFNLTFADMTKTLSDEEVTTVFEKIISDVESKLDAKVRNK